MGFSLLRRKLGTITAAVICWSQAVTAGDFLVAPDGDDAASGNESAPFATVARARDAAREDAAGPHRILLLPGVHRLDETIVLGHRDAGLTIEAVDPNKPSWISGATLLSRENRNGRVTTEGVWKVIERSEDDRPLWEAIVPEDWPFVRTLFFEGKVLPRARSKGFVQWDRPPARVPFRVRRAIDQRHMYLPKPVIDAFPDFSGAILRIIPRYPWVCHLLPMSEVDRDSGLVRSAVPGTYEMRVPAFGHFPEGTFWIENVPEAIDEPGEWCFHPETRKLTFWPPEGCDPDKDITVPRLTELLRIEGSIVETDLEDDPVRGITLRGLTFAHANAYGWEEDKTGWGLQHDWEMYDRPTAMVRLRAAEDCVIEDCRFVNSGAAGVRLDLHCRKNTVRHSEFSQLGGVGVLLAGYGLGFKDVNRDNAITDNHIHHIGQHWWHSPGIFAWQSGHNQIVHNHLHHLPYTGIVVSTRTQLSVSGDKESSRTARWDDVVFHFETRDRSWHNREPLMHGRFNEVAFNDIHHVMEKLGDGNAIYVSGTGKNNRLHHNFIHDVVSPNMNAAIRCDDDQHEVRIDHNVIARTAGEGFIWKGRCDLINNLVFCLQSRTPSGVATQHQRGYLVLSAAPVDGSNFQRNILFSREPRLPILYENPDRPARLKTANADHNLYWNPVNPKWAEDFFAAQRAEGNEEHSVFADPLLKNPKANDFTFSPESPVAELGIEPVDISPVGPRKGNRD